SSPARTCARAPAGRYMARPGHAHEPQLESGGPRSGGTTRQKQGTPWGTPRYASPVGAQPGDEVGGDALQDRELVRAGRVHDELVDARLAVASDHFLEGGDARPGISEPLFLHLGRPAVERAPDSLGVPADRGAVFVEDAIPLAHLRHRSERVPGVGILRADP